MKKLFFAPPNAHATRWVPSTYCTWYPTAHGTAGKTSKLAKLAKLAKLEKPATLVKLVQNWQNWHDVSLFVLISVRGGFWWWLLARDRKLASRGAVGGRAVVGRLSGSGRSVVSRRSVGGRGWSLGSRLWVGGGSGVGGWLEPLELQNTIRTIGEALQNNCRTIA